MCHWAELLVWLLNTRCLATSDHKSASRTCILAAACKFKCHAMKQSPVKHYYVRLTASPRVDWSLSRFNPANRHEMCCNGYVLTCLRHSRVYLFARNTASVTVLFIIGGLSTCRLAPSVLALLDHAYKLPSSQRVDLLRREWLYPWQRRKLDACQF